MLELSPRKPIKHNLKIEESKLKVQKIGDFWGGIYERDCRIYDRTLYIDSIKEKKDRVIDLSPYTIDLDHKNKRNK